MSLLDIIRRVLTGIRSVLDQHRPAAEPAALVLPIFPEARAPAVAGFVKRAPADFRLGARLASVALLNVPQGRKPRRATAASTLPPVPTARLGAKRLRLSANQGLRVLRPASATVRPSATVIPFPAPAAPTARLAKAA